MVQNPSPRKNLCALSPVNGGNQCLTVGFAFEYGQAEMMRAHAADQKVVAVEQQVLRRHRRSHIIAGFQYQSGARQW